MKKLKIRRKENESTLKNEDLKEKDLKEKNLK